MCAGLLVGHPNTPGAGHYGAVCKSMPVAWPAVRLIDCSVPTAHVDVTCSVLAEQLLPSGSLPDTSTVDCSSVMHVMILSSSGNALMGLP